MQDMHNDSEVAWDLSGLYSTDIFAARAVQVIESHASEHADDETPLFLYLPWQTMHAPIMVDLSFLLEPKWKWFAAF
jgi:hypothetical protein